MLLVDGDDGTVSISNCPGHSLFDSMKCELNAWKVELLATVATQIERKMVSSTITCYRDANIYMYINHVAVSVGEGSIYTH